MPPPLLSIQGLCIGCSRRSVEREGRAIELTETQWLLLDALLAASAGSVPRQVLLDDAWGPAFRRDEAYLMVEIWRLRQKLEPRPDRPVLIKTTRDGYRLDPCGQSPCVCLMTPLEPDHTEPEHPPAALPPLAGAPLTEPAPEGPHPSS